MSSKNKHDCFIHRPKCYNSIDVLNSHVRSLYYMENKKQKIWNLFRDNMECFLTYCFFGWVYESIWCCLIYHRRGFINRGFLFGPWLPIYGTGFFIILGIFKLLRVRKPLWVFVVGTLIAVTAELIASPGKITRKIGNELVYFGRNHPINSHNGKYASNAP